MYYSIQKDGGPTAESHLLLRSPTSILFCWYWDQFQGLMHAKQVIFIELHPQVHLPLSTVTKMITFECVF